MKQTYAAVNLAHAIRVLGDVHAEGDDRENAARVIQVLLLRAHPTEADLADIIRALSRALGVHLAIRRVLGELQRLRSAEVEKVARSLEHLVVHALQEGHDDALYQLVLITLEEPAWASRIRDECGKAVLVAVIERLPGSKYPVALLVGGWLCARGDVPEWMRELVENRPHLITSSVLPPATRWQLHRASPSVAGWRSLADLRGEKPVLEASSFGPGLDVAVDILQQAVGETPDEARKSVLGRWLHELTGSVP